MVHHHAGVVLPRLRVPGGLDEVGPLEAEPETGGGGGGGAEAGAALALVQVAPGWALLKN